MNEYFKRLQSERIPSAQCVDWKQFGPGSAGYCEVVRYHPAKPDCVVMSPDMYDNYVSWDNGTTWETVSDCDGTSNGIWRMRDICFSLRKPEHGLAVDERGWLWTTRDSGRSWRRNHEFPARGICSVVTFDPVDDRIIYVGSGNFWNVKWNKRTFASPRREKPEPTVHDAIISDFQISIREMFERAGNREDLEGFDPLRYSRTCYARISLTEYGKIWRSSDGGSNWELVNNGIPGDADIGKILFHPLDSKTLYMACNYGLYRSVDRGEQWENIGGNLPNNMLRDLAVYPDEHGRPVLTVIDQVFWNDDGKGSVSTTGGVFRSHDQGGTWESLNDNLCLDLRKTGPYVVASYYSAISRWFGISVAEAKSRYPNPPSDVLQNFNRLAVDPSDTQRMYLGHNAAHDISFYAGDLWRTEDGGEHWIVCNRTGPDWSGVDRDFWKERGNPTNTNMRFAHLQRQVSEKHYGGRTGCRALTVNSRGDLITVMEQQTLRSTDHGETWQQIDAVETELGSGCWVGTGCSNLTRPRYHMDSRLDGQWLLPCGEHGLWQLCEGVVDILPGVPAVRQIVGQSRTNDDPKSIATIAFHPGSVDTMYMQMYRQEHAGYVRKTVDGGKTWTNISRPFEFSISLATEQIPTHSFLIEEDNPERMYFCAPSYDKFSGVRPSRTFNGYGVWRSADEGASWESVNNGLPAEANVTDLCFDNDDRRIIYAALLKSIDGKTAGGLYRTRDRGRIWNALPVPEQLESVNDVHVDTVTGAIYVACGLNDGDVDSGGVWKSCDKGVTWEKIFHMPLAFSVHSSPGDPDRLAVIAGENSRIRNLNPGAYLSFDGGMTWHKSNRGLGQPYWVVDLKFDIADPNVVWCGLLGSGWYKGVVDRLCC